jgi:arylsulfatase A-like enzyme
VQGRSLRPLLTDPGAAWPARSLLAQVIQKGFTIEAIREGRYKFIRHSRGPRMGTEELYDLEADPRERTNLASDAPARMAGLRKSLEVFNEVLSRTAAEIPAEQVRALDRDTERALRSLGYIK